MVLVHSTCSAADLQDLHLPSVNACICRVLVRCLCRTKSIHENNDIVIKVRPGTEKELYQHEQETSSSP